RRVFAIKGIGGFGRPLVSPPKRTRSIRGERPINLFGVGVDEAKIMIMRRLEVNTPGPGYSHFPADRSAEYFHQLTAEKLITRYVKGFPRPEWHKTRRRNEALDCRVYALAALKILNPKFHKLASRSALGSGEKAPQDSAGSGPHHTARRSRFPTRRRE
ncbi:phage terminase large subunit family protein, partial [Haematospirillum jordaniae]|nr:phage terminase large subunit family protein [Haematospirillum jordaniae]